MKYTNEELEEQIATLTSNAGYLLSMILENEDWSEALVDGHRERGDTFLRFLLVPRVLGRAPEDWIKVFDASYCMSAPTSKELKEKLLEALHWSEILDNANRQIGYDDVLSWDDEALQVALEDRYHFIRTYEQISAFDKEAIHKGFIG
ncbi:hypothetical protein [Gulosibacter molinativorax]|uniref:DUF4240 domain-containing protein n=1 Tax=Gulosibacter molinativorax TaxID=256821 RepID=A0ABT7CBW7_9MICO|nr:hypothetical protein [Gulosibacter molinativorax]MDJ1372655.1 hypothetical protein [Gulosibacter molinativorax]QUY62389.1 Hypotetical protein [Gulosibacter molinativorax]